MAVFMEQRHSLFGCRSFHLKYQSRILNCLKLDPGKFPRLMDINATHSVIEEKYRQHMISREDDDRHSLMMTPIAGFVINKLMYESQPDFTLKIMSLVGNSFY